MRHAARAGSTALFIALAASALAGPAEGAARTARVAPEVDSALQDPAPARPDTSAAPEGPTRVHAEAQDAIDRLKSPFCPGLMLEVCPSPQAGDVRDSLNALAHRGVESDSLVALVLAAYGEEWRAVPEARGGGLLAWVMPPLVLLLGLVGLVVGLRRFTGAPAGEGEEGPDISEEERERLTEALHELEAEEEPLF